VLDEWAAVEGKVAIITGGGGGLGLPITEDLARAGMRVGVCDRDPEAVATVAKRLSDLGADSVVELFDVRESERLANFFDIVDRRLGGVHLLVNVPGGSFRKPAIDLTPNGVTAVIRQNFTHVLEASQLAARRMRATGSGGCIVTISTIEAHRAMPDMAVYGAMKAAVEQLTRTLAVEWGQYNIRVNAIAPDHFPPEGEQPESGLQRGGTQTDDHPLQDTVNIPLGRGGTGRDLSGCVLFLASDLSSYVTGTTLHVDGGTLAASGWTHWGDRYMNKLPSEVKNFLDTV
jgi:NAD(P)-dependent dehydrogenase (short-subunit alcohol dehydrogenase family)